MPRQRGDIGRDHRDQVTRRIASALRLVAPDSETARRIETAPSGYVLAHAGGDIARHAALLEPLPSAGEVRVIATPGRSANTWHLDIASLDRPGLLAVFTGVLVHAGIDVAQAVLATWDDGGALQALITRSVEPPDLTSLHHALEWSLGQPTSAPPVADATVTFDAAASQLYTSCEVVAPDRPGLLHAVAVAITNAGADIHSASVVTVDGTARDKFDLSDQAGRKLTETIQDAIAKHLRTGGVVFGGVEVR